MTDSLRNREHKRYRGYLGISPCSRGGNSIMWVHGNTLVSYRDQLGDKITTSRLHCKS